MIIHLNGWPGAGKKTIGRLLAERLGARFIHNHLLHDVAIVCAGLGSEACWPLYERVRAAAYETLAALPSTEVLVMTNALCTGAPRERAAWRHVVELAIARRVTLVPVVLHVEASENVRRLQSPERIGKKMTDPAGLLEFFEQDTIQRPDVPELFEIDVTRLTAEEAAERIAAHLEDVRPTLGPATERHLQLLGSA
jgi:broad-specificity NMP kinase